MLARWREQRRLRALARQPRGGAGLELLRGPADRQRPARLPPRPLPRLQGRLPALPDDVRLPGAAQGGLGLPRAAGRARGRKAARHLLQAGDRGVRDRRVQPALPRVGLRVRRGVEPADRADRLLDRPRRPLRDARERLHRVGLVVAAPALGRRTASTRATRSSPTARAAAPRSPRTRSRRATRTSRTPRSTCASRCSPTTAPRRASRCWSGRRRPGPCPATSPSPSRPDVTYVRAELEGEVLILAEPLVEKVLGEGAEVLDALLRRRAGRPPLPRPGLRARRRRTAGAGRRRPGDRRRLRHHRGRHRPRPHRPRLRRGRLRGRRRERDLRPDPPRHPLQPGQARRQLRRPRRRLRGPLRQGPGGDRAR